MVISPKKKTWIPQKGLYINDFEMGGDPNHLQVTPCHHTLEVVDGLSSLACAITSRSQGSPLEMGPNLTPLKINMEHNHVGLEDHFPF